MRPTRTDRTRQRAGFQPLARRDWIVFLEIDRTQIDARGSIECGRERILKNVAPRRIRTRLERRKYPPAWEPLGDRLERDADRGRVMRKVIDHSHSRRRSDHLLPAHHALEGAHPAGNLAAGDSK